MASPARDQTKPEVRRNVPIGLRISNAMHKLGVHGSPKNYEIFYDALTGINPDLNSDFWALGHSISQEQLDSLRKKHYDKFDGNLLAERVHRLLAENLSSAIEVLKDEQDSISAYGRVLDKTTDTVSMENDLSPETFLRVIEVLAHATGSTLNRGKAALSSMIEKSDELKSMESELEEYKRLAETDGLTGVWNRRAFDTKLPEFASEDKSGSSLVVIDIDHFKRVNDMFGHPFGDSVIRDVAQLIRFNLRSDVFVARTGGEEFAIFLERTGRVPALAIANRLVAAVRGHGFRNTEVNLKPGSVTVSAGVCSVPPAKSGDDLYTKADEALYSSKRNGRDQATLYEIPDTSPKIERKNYYLYRD